MNNIDKIVININLNLQLKNKKINKKKMIKKTEGVLLLRDLGPQVSYAMVPAFASVMSYWCICGRHATQGTHAYSISPFHLKQYCTSF